MSLDESEELELLQLKKKRAETTHNPYRGRRESSYDNVADEDLNTFQRGERGAQRMGLVQPGYEMFSPKAMKAKKNAALPIAAGAAGAGLVSMAPGLLLGPALKWGGRAMIGSAGWNAGSGLIKKLFE